ncbi:Crp/Fnr family transcriptional regulator [Desulfoscipio geothermicus]|uniref:CRP/FNR family transcriptional regulator, anaerobic regulatory protein n=1 Tax=Desulfoscipio geothermicus DSM 3669 TaxID=1121426 RepID=A0A1I6D4K9_9FIRM|nr:Crp/Fnr family transcriptional regulator [Desulfoscipio geothermicus]SFR00321.1 CRP/FNR family transcriptional regulator, anaerobic regulatory protein [Desulfoscipio geothermicus DSM 3669]
MSDNLQYLKKIPLFAFLTDEQLAEVDKVILERAYQKGRIIFMEGEPGEAVFFVKSGRIKVTKQTSDGREHILHFINPGEIFAEVIMFDDDGTYPATAEVVEDCTVGLIRNADMERIINQKPGIALGMLRIMARRLRISQQQLIELALLDTTRRAASMLLFLAGEQGTKTKEGIVIDISLTNQDLAQLIGTSRETANRILNDFKRQKAIAVHKGQVTILDKYKLKSWI